MVLEETIDTIFNGIFVHRYRDTNETIRGDCIMELGNWVVTYPEVFLDNAYLRYLGWVLSDKVIKKKYFACRNEAIMASLIYDFFFFDF